MLLTSALAEDVTPSREERYRQLVASRGPGSPDDRPTYDIIALDYALLRLLLD